MRTAETTGRQVHTEKGPTAMHAPPHHRADNDPWTERAACRDTDPETFFPPTGTSEGLDREDAAKRLCGRCPVARECLRVALLRDERAGIWGGFNARERRELLRIAGTLEAISAELAAFLAGGGRRISATLRDRPAYVWFLRRHGWTPRRIAGALGITFGQVQQAWQAAELASLCIHGPVSSMPNPRAPRRRVRRPAEGAGERAARGVAGVERPGVPADSGRPESTATAGRGRTPVRVEHPGTPATAERSRMPLAADRPRLQNREGSRLPFTAGPTEVPAGDRKPRRRFVPDRARVSLTVGRGRISVAAGRARLSVTPERPQISGARDRARVPVVVESARVPVVVESARVPVVVESGRVPVVVESGRDS